MENIEEEHKETPENHVSRWSTRRKMAWRAFFFFTVFTFLFWFALPLWFQVFDLSGVWLDIISDSYGWFAFFMISIILGYMGTSALPMTRFGKGGVPKPPRYNNMHGDD